LTKIKQESNVSFAHGEEKDDEDCADDKVCESACTCV
jgi:hypothetical protein